MNISNQVSLIGNLGKDFELKDFGNGRKMAKSTFATNESFKNKEGEYVQKTEWHTIIAWGKKAEILSGITRKGSSIALTGKIIYNKYEDKEGNKRSKTEIQVMDFKLLDKKKVEETAPF